MLREQDVQGVSQLSCLIRKPWGRNMSGLFSAAAADPARRTGVQKIADATETGGGIGRQVFGGLAQQALKRTEAGSPKRGRGKTGPRTILESAHRTGKLGRARFLEKLI